MSSRRARGVGALVAFAALAAFAALTAGGAGAGGQTMAALPRAQTFYMSGNQWSPNNDLNPAKNWDYITGLVGFAYETPFRYDPLKDKFIPWLATGGKWTSKHTYTMTIRSGVKWSDGQPMTAKDVAYSFNLLKAPTHPQHPLFADTGLKMVKASGNNVLFTFAGTPAYQEFDNYRFNVAVVPQHVFKAYSTTDLTTGNLSNPKKIVGTGPYLYQSGVGAASNTVVWKKNPSWWATRALGLNVAPQYVVDIKNGTNAAALSNLLAGNIDLFNNFAPKSAIKGGFKTYFDKAPYHLGANTTWLFPNTTKKPLNDPKFRRALAESINIGQIIDKSYQGLVNKASPTGLLPIWNKWIDKKVVAKDGFSYSPARAKATLAAAGYKDTDGDGYVENKDGSPIALDIVVPNGWSDWMTAIQVISESAKQVGIKLTPGYPEYATLVDDRGHSRFDIVLGNDRQMSNTPWTYYQYIYNLPITDNQTTMNYERYTNRTAFNLTQKLNRTPSTNTKAYQAVLTSLQKLFLRDLPAIPLWYNGMWSMVNTQYWTGWPSAGKNQFTPSSWRNYWQMTSIDMLTHLRPAKAD
ncbi:ABC transporter substrate-binding protein [Gaiella sp.]|jgi:peptide/nickel transport system substrate-binding protein|uniref:ABC transporter substrate-binding protein n=1 Tax=Gaiella sp. TaxID=2663207 RepID=UPI002E305031|nr:ABC transporter substrate-binding protein [Gaiella sp.]HEX5582733.1 ABC transporter substrate-binding protein [Gaiella sp.]